MIELVINNQSQVRPLEVRSDLICDECHSADIIENEFGYVCRECGVVLGVQILQYHRPYNNDIVQYAPLGKTQIGFKKERIQNPQSYRLNRLSRLDTLKSNEETVKTKANLEINRIFDHLSLPQTDKQSIYTKFLEIRRKLGEGTKYRNPEKLVPLVIYFYYKMNCKPIDEKELLEIGRISKDDFQAFKLQILDFWPQYKERNRRAFVEQRIMEITEHFGLGMYFYYQSKKIMSRLWGPLKNTKDDVIAGVVTSISALCLPECPVTVSEICNRLNIRMSTIHKQVENKIFERLRVPGFKSLVRSADLLRDVMERLGLILDQFITKEAQTPDIIEIELGNAISVKRKVSHDPIENYFYILREKNNHMVTLSLEVNRQTINEIMHESASKVALEPEHDVTSLFNLVIWKGKGPPLCVT